MQWPYWHALAKAIGVHSQVLSVKTIKNGQEIVSDAPPFDPIVGAKQFISILTTHMAKIQRIFGAYYFQT